MRNFKWMKTSLPNPQSKDKEANQNRSFATLKQAKKNIYWQAGLALMTIVLTIVIVFAMTSAWYTNVVQSDGLAFKAESWGFKGTVLVQETPIIAGPGDDGVIYLEVANESNKITAVGVNISKAKMSEEMQRRLFFYVDAQRTQNGETMDRIYLNNRDSYTYTLFDYGRLTLTEEMHNDAQLKWVWVYDVLGYYVYGTEEADGRFRVSEYLRPIEYNYDEATTTFQVDEDGNWTATLQTVDGKTTVEEFLIELSKTDGYDGVINVDEQLKSGYYPVAVEENADGIRCGVYAYLCSFSEIQQANQFDTQLGQDAANGTALQCEAQITISAQKARNNVVNVTTLEGLNKAMEMGAADVIQLSGNITVPDDQALVIAEGQKVMLDLNGHTITTDGAKTAVKVEEGGFLTMINGTVDGGGTAANGVYAIGAEVTLSNVTLQGCTMGLRIADDEGMSDSRVHLVNSTVDAGFYGIFIKGNGGVSERLTQLIVEGCTIRGDVVGIGGNGSKNMSGTDIQVIHSTVEGNPDQSSSGIFHPQEHGTLTVYESTVTGYNGISIKGGSVYIYSSEVVGSGEKTDPAFFGSGSATTGDGIYIETNYGNDILLEISGASKITSEHSYSLQVYEKDAPNVTIRIYGGTFDQEQPEEYIAKGSVQNGTTVTPESEEP